jgi:NAD(P)-dependent dehydrogenase (short-subunit alcohol dehydrogenase family)
MKIQDCIPFVTGANRGLGLAFVGELVRRGARKVYAGVRDPAAFNLPGVIPIQLDVNNPEEVAAAAARCGDTTLLINNAGIAEFMDFLDPAAIAAARETFEVNFYGPIRMSQAFAPVLGRNGGGAVINVLSVASWISGPSLAIYAASKSAAWGFTNGLRNELRAQGTQVLALHAGFIDTEMSSAIDAAKVSPQAVAAQALDGLEAGLDEVLADDLTRAVKQGLSANPGIYLTAPQR